MTFHFIPIVEPVPTGLDRLTAWSTFATAIAAFGAVGIAAWIYFVHDRPARREAQARRVAAWMSFREYKGQTRWMTEIRNTSELPVYDWWLEYKVVVNNRMTLTCSTETNFIHAANLPPNFPMPDQALYDPLLAYLSGKDSKESKDWKVSVSIDFRDAAGKLWTRDHEGRLEELNVERQREPRTVLVNGQAGASARGFPESLGLSTPTLDDD